MIRVLWLCVLGLAPLLSLASDVKAPAVARESLDPERIEVYRAFLVQWIGREGVLNLADRTSPLRVESRDASCMRGLAFVGTRDAGRVVHRMLVPYLLEGRARLVDANGAQLKDPADAIAKGDSVADAVHKGVDAGLMTVSEIAFDRKHTHAVLQYSFVCGALCGSGSTVLMEKKDGQWARMKRDCGGWIS